MVLLVINHISTFYMNVDPTLVWVIASLTFWALSSVFFQGFHPKFKIF